MISVIPLRLDQQNLNFDSVILWHSTSYSSSLAKPLCLEHMPNNQIKGGAKGMVPGDACH
jgi:hypothetical protein